MSLNMKQAEGLLKLVGLKEQSTGSPGSDDAGNTDLVDRLARKIHIDLIAAKDTLRERHLRQWPRTTYHAVDLFGLLGRPYITSDEANQLRMRLADKHISVLCLSFEDIVATMHVQFPPPLPKRRKRKHH